MKKLIFMYCLITCSVQAESFLERVWQIEKPEVTQSTPIKKTIINLNTTQTLTAYLNKDIQFPLVIENEIKGTVTFKQGREVVIVSERPDSLLIAIGTFSGEVKKQHITFN